MRGRCSRLTVLSFLLKKAEGMQPHIGSNFLTCYIFLEFRLVNGSFYCLAFSFLFFQSFAFFSTWVVPFNAFPINFITYQRNRVNYMHVMTKTTETQNAKCTIENRGTCNLEAEEKMLGLGHTMNVHFVNKRCRL